MFIITYEHVMVIRRKMTQFPVTAIIAFHLKMYSYFVVVVVHIIGLSIFIRCYAYGVVFFFF